MEFGVDGLSPRVRGNQFLDSGFYKSNRSIPACAGEPADIWALCAELRVYPRVCGGTRRERAHIPV